MHQRVAQSIIRITMLVVACLGVIFSLIYIQSETKSWTSLFVSLSQKQIDGFLLLMISSVVLYTVFNKDSLFFNIDDYIKNIIRILKGEHINDRKSKNIDRKITNSINIIILVFIGIQSLFIFIVDLTGGIPGSLQSQPEIEMLIKKMSLIVFGIAFVTNDILYRQNQKCKIENQFIKITKAVSNFVKQNKIIILNREEFHKDLETYLENIEESSEIFVTHFEEPIEKMKKGGYYYESEFMKKWYKIAQEKKLTVNMVILLNKPKDYDDLIERIDTVSSIKHFYISVLIAPPLILYFDFLLHPGKYALLCTSEDPRNPQLNTIAISTRNPDFVNMLYKMFMSNILPKSIHVKTSEGINKNNLEKVKKDIEDISKTRSKKIKELFNFPF